MPTSTQAPVIIAGGGPVGLTLAALLARLGVPTIVVEADDGYCQGSRAICLSRRSQEILGWVGADEALTKKGLPWVGGRSYYRGDEVLHFTMPSEPGERFAPMVNIQQYYVEQFAHEAALQGAAACDVRWSTRVAAVRRHADGVEVDVQPAGGGAIETLRSGWLVACDGGRSTVRDELGLALSGTQYEGRYVIVDIRQKTRRDVERLAWFDPPSNPGSTLLMHRQPDDVWRIDYQIGEFEDPIEAIKPENVLPRVQSHLTMIGEHEPWEALWISIYNAKCLTLDSYRHGRVFFAGDAAHLVPIFGVRGLNSGLDDAGNLAWKLAAVWHRQVGAARIDTLLDSYSHERVLATRVNLAYGAKSTEFMAPPDFAFKLMREATLRLARENPQVKSLINPRQSTPIRYEASPISVQTPDEFTAGPLPGDPAPDASLASALGIDHLTRRLGSGFVVLKFASSESDAPLDGSSLADLPMVNLITIRPAAAHGEAGTDAWVDHLGEAWRRYDALPGTVYLIRPDGYVMARWRKTGPGEIHAALSAYLPEDALALTSPPSTFP